MISEKTGRQQTDISPPFELFGLHPQPKCVHIWITKDGPVTSMNDCLGTTLNLFKNPPKLLAKVAQTQPSIIEIGLIWQLCMEQLEDLVFTHLPVDAKHSRNEIKKRCRKANWMSCEARNRKGSHNSSTGGNKPREQKGGELSGGGQHQRSFNSSGLVRYGYAYWRHRRGRSVHQHASEHQRASAPIRIVQWIMAYSAMMSMDDAWWMNVR